MDNPSELPLESELRKLKPIDTRDELSGRIALECELSAMRPIAPSDLQRDRILLACGLDAEPSASAKSTFPIRWAAAAAALLLGLALALASLQPPERQAKAPENNPVPEPAPTPAIKEPSWEESDHIQIAKLPAMYTPVSASRTFVSSKPCGVEQVDGKPVEVFEVMLRDRLEYEHKGRRVIVERPVQQTIYNELAVH